MFDLRYGLLTCLMAATLSSPAHAQDPALARQGERVYNNYCSTCHGDNLVNSGNATFDLRRLRANERQRFETSVTNGKNQMPPWKGVVSPEEIEQLWHYIRTHAHEK